MELLTMTNRSRKCKVIALCYVMLCYLWYDVWVPVQFKQRKSIIYNLFELQIK